MSLFNLQNLPVAYSIVLKICKSANIGVFCSIYFILSGYLFTYFKQTSLVLSVEQLLEIIISTSFERIKTRTKYYWK